MPDFVFLIELIPCFAAHAEADELPLVAAEACFHAPRLEHGQMDKRAKAPITHQQIAGPQQWVKHPDPGLFMPVEGKPQHLHDHAGESIEQSQELWDGKTTAALLAFGLAKGLLQIRGVGRNGAGAID
jgi:hypothetical protein